LGQGFVLPGYVEVVCSSLVERKGGHNWYSYRELYVCGFNICVSYRGVGFNTYTYMHTLHTELRGDLDDAHALLEVNHDLLRWV
jgi:hypothetical protein